ncbi:hypothetical protein [Pandoraea cepalis]|uniref:hypothetical protein n=1 Tax=Pandoraea cepalis TaxID=2508294 RepID=UPI00263ABC5D|nr:hypothetical protein [Pandoraea cepalis]
MNKPEKPQRRRPTRLFRLYMRDVKRHPPADIEHEASRREADETNQLARDSGAEEKSHGGGN